MNFTLKIYKNSREVQRVQTCSRRRFLKKTRTINWQDSPLKVYLRINYGKHKDNYGKTINFWNDGEYSNRADFDMALQAFMEEEKK